MSDDHYSFPNCMHALAAALHRNYVNPDVVIISLPKDEWWRLWSAIESKYKEDMMFDSRTGIPCPIQFTYMGFTFRIEK